MWSGCSKTQPSQRRLPNDGLCHNRDALWDAGGSRPRSRLRRRTHHLRRRARVASRGGFGAGLVRGHLRTRAGVEEEARAPLPGVAREAAPLPDSVRLRGPGRDADFLREDPLLKLSCGSLPESGADLASQPTLSRLENAATRRSCHRIAEAIFELYLSERASGGAPRKVLLDLDSTADPTHGDQEGSYYHGYYREHIYHPLLVFDGESGHLICALLRAGDTHASRSAVAVLKRIVARMRQKWPEVKIELRADAGFAVPALYEYCEKEGIDYTVGLITNPRLEALAESLLNEAKNRH